jgi:hypothetical protein
LRAANVCVSTIISADVCEDTNIIAGCQGFIGPFPSAFLDK